MSSCEGVVCLPTLVWYHITRYLSPRDLVSLSVTCRQLRYFLNENSVWKSHVRSPATSEALAALQSVVPPVFIETSSDTEETPCQSKVDLLRENRLLSNLRKGKCVQYSYEFKNINACRTQDPFGPVGWQTTYKSIYLFLVELADGNNDVVHVINIENSPTHVTSFPLINHIDPEIERWGHYWIHVVGNKLIIMTEYKWLDIYEINLPSLLFPHLRTIKLLESDQLKAKPLIRGHIVFCSSDDLTITNIWNLDSGVFIKAIKSSTKDATMHLIYSSLISNYILFTVHSTLLHSCTHVTSYDVKSMQFTQTKLDVSEILTRGLLVGGLSDGVHVVLFMKHDFTILVYDCKSSCLINSKRISDGDTFFEDRSTIINNCLLFPSVNNVKIFNLPDLETVWYINVNPDIVAHEYDLREIYYFSIQGLYNLIVIQRVDSEGEVWDFESRKKLFGCLECADNIVLTESGSKIVLEPCSFDSLKIFNFW